MSRLLSCCAAAAYLLCGGSAVADVFGTGMNSFEIEFVTIGNAGNPPDANPNPAGAVAYEYRIGKYEVSEQMIEKANELGGLGITIDDRGPDFPATSVTWFEAARFVNWLNESEGHPVAYKFDDMGAFQLWEPIDPGYDPNNLYRNRRAFYFLPSLNEWHKAAYYDPVNGVYYDYPTGSDSIPDGLNFVGDPNFEAVFFDGGGIESQPNDIFNVGLFSPFGTLGQGGNVREFQETAIDRINDVADEHRGAVGGRMNDSFSVLAAFNAPEGRAPLAESPIVGFRIGSIVPEPGTIWILGSGFVGPLFCRKRRGHVTVFSATRRPKPPQRGVI
jgi:hypothetical protein